MVKGFKRRSEKKEWQETSRWLTEEDGGRNVHGDGLSHGPNDEQGNPTRQFNAAAVNNSNRPTINIQSLPCPPLVPLASPNRQGQMIASPAFTARVENNGNRHSDEISITQQLTSVQQPLLSLTALDNPLIHQSLPNNSIINHSLPHQNQPPTSYTLSPIITETLKIIPSQQFSFNATNEPIHKQPLNLTSKPSKNNPTHKLTRTGPTRTEAKLDPNRPTPDPTQQLSVSMEVQTEKKRRRDDGKEKEEVPTVIQHFLTAGPGSQDCRDQ
jgi:hypothetical protein